MVVCTVPSLKWQPGSMIIYHSTPRCCYVVQECRCMCRCVHVFQARRGIQYALHRMQVKTCGGQAAHANQLIQVKQSIGHWRYAAQHACWSTPIIKKVTVLEWTALKELMHPIERALILFTTLLPSCPFMTVTLALTSIMTSKACLSYTCIIALVHSSVCIECMAPISGTAMPVIKSDPKPASAPNHLQL